MASALLPRGWAIRVKDAQKRPTGHFQNIDRFAESSERGAILRGYQIGGPSLNPEAAGRRGKAHRPSGWPLPELQRQIPEVAGPIHCYQRAGSCWTHPVLPTI